MSLFNILCFFVLGIFIKVSILVLMDVTLQPEYTLTGCSLVSCFNPCFNGCHSSTTFKQSLHIILLSFNPCFNGCHSSTRQKNKGLESPQIVSILVLMDVTLQPSFLLPTLICISCFNPCFNGCHSSTILNFFFTPFQIQFQSLF